MDHRLDDTGDHTDGQHRWTPAGGSDIVGLELIVFATVFTLIVLLTGGPSNHI